MRRQADFCLLALHLLVPMDAMVVVSSLQTDVAGAQWQWLVCSSLAGRPPVAVTGSFKAMHFVVPSSDSSIIKSQVQHTFPFVPDATTTDCAASSAMISLQPCSQCIHGAMCSAQGQMCCRMPLLFSKHTTLSQSCV